MPVCHYSPLALGSPSGQCHMAYIGTPAPLIFPRTMAQETMDTFHGPYFHFCLELALETWNKAYILCGFTTLDTPTH